MKRGERRGRERREFGRSRFRSKTPKTETNHDNDSHETLFQTRATHAIYSKFRMFVFLCVPFLRSIDGNLIGLQATKSFAAQVRCSQAFHIRRQNIAIKYFPDPPSPLSRFGSTISSSIRFEAPSINRPIRFDARRCGIFSPLSTPLHLLRSVFFPAAAGASGGASFSANIKGRRETTVLVGSFTFNFLSCSNEFYGTALHLCPSV